jgi:hypothetical protein
MDISKRVEWLKLSPRYLLPVAMITGFLLFAPNNILDILGLVDLIKQYRPYIGGALLISLGLLLSNILAMLFDFTRQRSEKSKRLKQMRKRLHNLTEEEKALLRGYVERQSRTQYFDMENGVARGLEAERIIFQASNIGRIDSWAYNIQPWAWTYLSGRPELLKSSKISNNDSRNPFRGNP